MSEVVVTRADREAAARLSFASIKRPEIRAYVEAGEGAEDSYCDVHDIATVIAKARAEGVAAGRLAERRDVVALIDSCIGADHHNAWKWAWRYLRDLVTSGAKVDHDREPDGAAGKEPAQ